MMRNGPLQGLKIVEFGAIGPTPFTGMLFSDLGADVIRIDRKTGRTSTVGMTGTRFAVTERGRRSVAFDLKHPEAVQACLRLIAQADALVEGFRPGVMERLGLGPSAALSRNPKLVYGRMTGWGQTGPYAHTAGHDLNYLAISGALAAIGTREEPVVPLNLVGDFGGALFLAFGLLAGVLHSRSMGEGQVIDCAMSDCAASLMSMFYGLNAMGQWMGERQSNLLDGGAHFYGTYKCADGSWISIGSIEPQFYALLLEKLEIRDPAFEKQMDRQWWPMLRQRLADAIVLKTQAEWCRILGGSDVCFAPVLDMNAAPDDPHNVARQTFLKVAGVVQPAPVPRFSRTPGCVQGSAPVPGAHNEDALRDWGFNPEEVQDLASAGAL